MNLVCFLKHAIHVGIFWFIDFGKAVDFQGWEIWFKFFMVVIDQFSFSRNPEVVLIMTGIFLSIIFMVGTVLVIYYKQISEGYEDRERFIILQKVGLDQKQIKQTINKQVLTVFFLPLLFAFIHLAFAYHMLSLILKVIGVIDTTMMLTVTLSICAIFLIAYVLIFMITSRSYRKIVQM